MSLSLSSLPRSSTLSRFFPVITLVCVLRYGGLSVGGQLPVVHVDPVTIQNFLYQLGNMMNITGVGTLQRHPTEAHYIYHLDITIVYVKPMYVKACRFALTPL